MRARTALGATLFVALSLAAVATAAVVLYAKTPNLALQVQRIGTCPAHVDQTLHRCLSIIPGRPGHDVAHIRFYVRYSDPHATVQIVGEGLSPARTLAAGVPLVANRPVSYTWDGRTNDGKLAPHGRYALRVNLPGVGRDMLWVNERLQLYRPRPGGS